MNLIMLCYINTFWHNMPISNSVYDKTEGKTKNDNVLKRLADVLAWALTSAFVTGNAWYSCMENPKTPDHDLALWLKDFDQVKLLQTGSEPLIRNRFFPTVLSCVRCRKMQILQMFENIYQHQLSASTRVFQEDCQ